MRTRVTDIVHNRMEPVPTLKFEEIEYRDARVYCFRVDVGNDPPYVVDMQDPRVYVRRGANDYVARCVDRDAMYASTLQSPSVGVYRCAA